MRGLGEQDTGPDDYREFLKWIRIVEETRLREEGLVVWPAAAEAKRALR